MSRSSSARIHLRPSIPPPINRRATLGVERVGRLAGIEALDIPKYQNVTVVFREVPGFRRRVLSFISTAFTTMRWSHVASEERSSIPRIDESAQSLHSHEKAWCMGFDERALGKHLLRRLVTR